MHAEPAATYAPVFDDLAHDAAHEIHGDGKADAFGPLLLGKHCGVDADQLTIHVDQRAAGIPKVDGRIGLNEICKGRKAQAAAADCTNDALRDGLAQTQRIADRKHDVAGAKLVGSAERHHREIRQIDAKDGEVSVRVRTDNRWSRHSAIGELDSNFRSVLNDVMIRYDVPACIDDDSRAETALELSTNRRQILLVHRAQRRGLHFRAHDTCGVNVDHGRGGDGNGIRKRATRLVGTCRGGRQWR